jgi:hypothetical protein
LVLSLREEQKKPKKMIPFGSIASRGGVKNENRVIDQDLKPGRLDRLIKSALDDIKNGEFEATNGVGPNAVNLRDMSCLCCLCGFLVGAEVGLLSFPWFYVADDAFADLGSFCDIPAALWGIGGSVWNARGVVRGIVQILPGWRAGGPLQQWTLRASRTGVSR